MVLAHSADTSPADWLVDSHTPWQQLVSFGPAGLPAYARLRFLPDPMRPGQAEADVELPPDAPSELAQVERALGHLANFTTTPDDCFCCIWDGYGEAFVPAGVLRRPLVTIPHRRYALFRGPLADIRRWDENFGHSGASFPPAFVWPAGHEWCFAKDVDPHWAGIGAEPEAIARLTSDPQLDVVPASPHESVPAYQ